MNFVQIIQMLLPVILPFIEKLIESTAVPFLQRKTYERYNEFTSERLHSLAILKQKLEVAPDGIKKEAYMEGLKLGTDTLRAVAETIIKGCDVLDG